MRKVKNFTDDVFVEEKEKGELAPSNEMCKLEKVVGSCKEHFPRYFYNTKTEKCEKFTYGGCRGNGNNFKTEDECQKACSY